MDKAALEERRRYFREYMRKYREEHRERLNEQKRDWNARNPDRIRKYNERYWAKRAREKAAAAEENSNS